MVRCEYCDQEIDIDDFECYCDYCGDGPFCCEECMELHDKDTHLDY